MHNREINVLEDIYSEELAVINDVHFTPREIDIIACLLSARGTNKIASFLSISPKTVRNHIHNIMIKLECNSRDRIIDFIERSNKIPILRRHYSNLFINAAFKKSLKDILKLNRGKGPCCRVVHWSDQGSKTLLIPNLEEHLKLSGLIVSTELRNKHQSLSEFIDEFRNGSYVIYILPNRLLEERQTDPVIKDIDPAQFSQGKADCLFLLPGKETSPAIPQEFQVCDFVDLAAQENYYFLFFEILSKLLPNINLEKIIAEFNQQYEITQGAQVDEYPQPHLKRRELEKKRNKLYKARELIIKAKQWFLLSALLTSIFCIGFLSINEEKQEKSSIRSDLIIPTEAVFLNRPELISQIDIAFNKRGGIQTVAFTGPGGAGKTTIARQYARSQRSPVVWEINAETRQSLKMSFETLAQGLSKTAEDKKLLSIIQEIRIPSLREEKIVQFVKDHLKAFKKWFLIYDNVEKFTDIQKHFPQDFNNWGQGKVIITTRDSNIQNNKHINDIIHIGEITPNQKSTLFTMIINNGNKRPLTAVQTEEAKIFLEKLPPFPLDVSIAAYYVRVTNISYENYLKLLYEYNNEFANLQENLLKEAGDYTKTRYSIVTLSLKRLIETHNDFKELLLLIGLLNSQNIPRNLLRMHKNDVLVDDFIYNLKKYSLITDEPSSIPLGHTLSIHQSIQPIIIAYLTKALSLEKNNKMLQYIVDTFKNYLTELTSTEDLLKMKLLISHVKTFLSHDNLLTSSMKGSIGTELGCIYFHLYHYIKAKKILEEGISNLNESCDDNHAELAWALVHLGCVYRELGDYEKAKNLLEEGFIIYNKYFPKNYIGITSTLTYLGIIHRKLGNYEKAKSLLEQSLIIYNKNIPKNHAGAARTLANLAYIYQNLGDYKNAKSLLEQDIIIFNKHLIKNQAANAWNLSHLGNVYRKLGNHKEAEKLLKESLTIFKTYFYENHNEATWVLAHIGDIYRELGDYKEAKKILKKTLVIYEKNYGKNHIKTAWILKNLGQVYFQEGNLEATENLVNKALNVFQQNKHPDIYMVFEDLAELNLKKSFFAGNKRDLQQSKNFKTRAINYLKQALKIVQTNSPEDSPHITRIQSKLKNLEEG